jgi:5'-3' exonuclease
MMSLFSSDLQTQLTAAGITFIPADSIYYTDFFYKVELSPKFEGLGGTTGDRYCTIKLGNPEKALALAAEFKDKIEKLVANIEYRQEICDFISSMPEVEYKSCIGGENNLFYFRDAASVMAVVDRYKSAINRVTGPINSAHTEVIGKDTIVLRNKLYHNKFRYYIEFTHSQDFVDNSLEILDELLNNLSQGSWRDLGLKQLLRFYEQKIPIQRYRMRLPPKTVAVYFEHQDDYIYAKLLTAEYVVSNHEVKLFTELDM